MEIPVLPNEVITEILSRLSVKPLLRFSSVSKFWKSLISDPHFVKLHLSRSPKNANLILTVCNGHVMSCSKSSLIQNPYFTPPDHYLQLKSSIYCRDKVLGSCNGLVCLLSSLRGGRVEERCRVCFWNPETRLKSKNSPSLTLCNRKLRCLDFGFGFGYDNSSDTYKVVILIKDSTEIRVKVYVMGDHRWRDAQTFPALPNMEMNKGNFVNNTLNWLAIHNSTASDYDWESVAIDQQVIVSFDLGKETYKHFLLPNGLHGNLNIGILGDCICLFHYKLNHFVVWQMKDFGVEKSWTQFVNISYQHLLKLSVKSFLLTPLCISENGDEMLLSNNFEIVMYNRRDNRIERVEYHQIRGLIFAADDHVQSLILPG